MLSVSQTFHCLSVDLLVRMSHRYDADMSNSFPIMLLLSIFLVNSCQSHYFKHFFAIDKTMHSISQIY